jgi:hypothetical protein
VPPSRSDRSLLLLAGSAVAIAAVLVGGLMLVITRSGSDVPEGLIFVGYEKSLKDSIHDEGPIYTANPFGDDGFWVDLENGDVVALVLNRPGTKDCNVKWKEPKHGYVDCNGAVLSSDQLDRYAVGGGPKDAPKDAVFANLKKVTPAPSQAPSGEAP